MKISGALKQTGGKRHSEAAVAELRLARMLERSCVLLYQPHRVGSQR